MPLLPERIGLKYIAELFKQWPVAKNVMGYAVLDCCCPVANLIKNSLGYGTTVFVDGNMVCINRYQASQEIATCTAGMFHLIRQIDRHHMTGEPVSMNTFRWKLEESMAAFAD